MIDINEVVKPFIPDIPFHKECDIDSDSKKLKKWNQSYRNR